MLTASIFPKQKNFLILDDITTSVWTWKFQVQNYTLSSERESHKHTNNTHVTYSVHLRGSYATETIYWWKNLTRVWGNLLERPLTLLPSTSSEQFKNLRVARHKVHIYIVWSKKLAVSWCFSFGFRTCFIKKKKSNTKYRLLTHLILWLIHLYAYSYLKKGACEYMNHSTMSLVHSLHTYLNIKCK